MVGGGGSGRALDRTSAVPLWAQLRIHLIDRIAVGEFGDGFPGEHALSSDYGVSRHTVREALRQLRQEGVLIAERGRAPRLAAPAVIEQPLGALYSLFRAVEATGLSQRSVVRALDVRRDRDAAATLELPADEPLLYVERLRMAGEEPLALDAAWLPASVAAPLLDADLTHVALYTELDRRCGVRLTGGREAISAVVPDPEQAALLGLGECCAALSIRRIGLRGESPIELRRTVIRADRFTVSARFSRTEGYALAPEDSFASA